MSGVAYARLVFALEKAGQLDKALETGVDLRICTKYWMEQMGLPFHPTHVHPQNQHDRRHGYADLLKYPQKYKVHWRMWSGGTTRLLLWADPEYVRRFAESEALSCSIIKMMRITIDWSLRLSVRRNR